MCRRFVLWFVSVGALCHGFVLGVWWPVACFLIFLISYLLDPSMSDRAVLKSPAVIMDSPIPPRSSVRSCLT